MFRRIEVIWNPTPKQLKAQKMVNQLFGSDEPVMNGVKGGLWTGNISPIEVHETWWDKCLGPGSSGRGNIPRNKNCRFFFTEKGWEECGSKACAKLREMKVEFRVITIKEKSVDVVWKASHEVAVRPRRKKC